MGGKSGKPTIGYWYDMDVLATACLKVDEVTEFQFADRSAWAGSVTESGTIAIYKDDLFGGEEREGGVFGQVDIMMGDDNQPVNEFLGSSMRASGITGPVPAYRNSVNFFFRGVTSADPEFPTSGVFTGEALPPPLSTVPSFTSKPKSQPKAFRWSAMNPYFKAFKVKVRRHTKDWHPEIAKITHGNPESNIPVNTTWNYCQFYYAGVVGEVHPELKTPPDVGGGGYTWGLGAAPIGWNSSGSYATVLPNRGDYASWFIKTITVPATSGVVTFTGFAENAGYLYIDGAYVYSNNPTNAQSTVVLPMNYTTALSPGQHTIAVFLTNEYYGGPSASTDVIEFSLAISFGETVNSNPAHIIRECLTDTDWGLGWPTSDIDDASFFAAATSLHTEQFGLSFKWSQQMTIEDFVMMVLRHINGVLYQDRVTGKFKLTLIRNDYVIGDLTELNPTNSNLESLSRAAAGEMVNIVNLSYSKPGGGTDTVTVHDIASIETQGPISQDIEMLGVTNQVLAARIAQRELESRVKPIAKITITTNRIGVNLHEGGLFKLNWPDLGISSMACRIVTIDLGQLTDNQIRIEAVQDVFGLPSTSYIKPQVTNWVNPTQTPKPAPVRFITETPYYDLARGLSDADLSYLDSTDCYLDVFATEPSTDALDYNLWSASGTAELTNRATGTHAIVGALSTSVLAAETSVLQITNTREIVYGIETENACIIINGEYAKITDYDTTANTITVNRGVLDTVPKSHPVNTQVILVDSSAGQDEISYLPGEVVSVKVQTRTAMGVLAISATPVDTYTISQRQARPYPPGKVRVNGLVYPAAIGSTDGLSLTWAHRNRLTQTAAMVSQSENSITPEPGTTYNLRIYGTTNTLLRSATSLSGEAYNYTTAMEEADMGSLGGGLAVDQYWPQTKLLLNFNGDNNSTTFLDSSGEYADVFGNAKISTTQFKFGGASGYFYGAGDYISFPTAAVDSFGSSDFTIELWMRPTANLKTYLGSTYATLIGRDNNALRGWGLTISGTPSDINTLSFVGYSDNSANTQIVVSHTFALDTWYHLRVVRYANKIYIFVDGVLKNAGGTSFTLTIQQSTSALKIGAAMFNASYLGEFTGFIDGVRITKASRGSSSFTPPTRELGPLIKPSDFANCGLLVNFESLTSTEINNPVLQSGDYAKNYADIAPYWSNTAYGESGDYAQTSIDVSDSKFGTKCGLGLYMYDRFDFGLSSLTGSITFDCWVKIPSTLTPTGFVYQIFAFDGLWQLGIQTPTHHWFDAGTAAMSGGGVSHPTIAETALLDQWVHYAITMTQTEVGGDHNTEIKLYKNGILFLTTSAELGIASASRAYPVRISSAFKCDEVRIRQGLHYTANFTPDTTPTVFVEPHWANTPLLMNFNGVNNSTAFENTGNIIKLATVAGNTKISTTQSKFGGASGYFDGNNDHLRTSISSPFGVNDFTIEGWFRREGDAFVGPAFTQHLFDMRTSEPSTQITLDVSGSTGSYQFGYYVNGVYRIAAGSATLNTWNHLALCRSAGVTKLFLNGSQIGANYTDTNNFTATTASIGGRFAAVSGDYRSFNGYIDDLRITKAARYTGNFTPPTRELSKYVPALNSQLTFELESERDGLVSWQKHRHTVTRA